MSGSRRIVPSPEHGASTSTQSKRDETGRRLASAWTTRMDEAPDAVHGFREEPDPPRPYVRCQNESLVSHGGSHRRRLAAG